LLNRHGFPSIAVKELFLMYQATTMYAVTINDSQKNVRAALITIAVHALLFLLFFFITIAMAVPVPPPVEEGIEVNLGNSDIGFGDVQPLVPDAPAPETQPEQTPPKQQIAQTVEDKEKEVSERNDADAPEITKPEKKTTVVKNTPITNTPVNSTKPAATTVVNPKPAPPKPKAVYTGGTGTGGNNSDTYNNSRNQGIAGGTGDQGKSNGSATSDKYDGNGGTGTSGRPRVIGNRKIIKYYSFEGDLEKATIYAIVKVTPEGKGTFVGFGKNSTSRSQAYANSIINYLRNIQFDKSTDESTVTVQFNFKVND
jgi:outer membrane biosynthesis protein TonB